MAAPTSPKVATVAVAADYRVAGDRFTKVIACGFS
jgi:hypothetical protein